MAERPTVPRETNPLLVALAEVAIAVLERRHETEERRRTIRVVGATTNKGRNAA